MQDYSISRCTRKCAISGKMLEPGEAYFAVIVPSGDDVSRKDISAAHWSGPDEQVIGWWKTRMPDEAAKKQLRPAPVAVLLDTLSDLLDRPGKETLAYLLSVLLVRRRVLQEEAVCFPARRKESDRPDQVWNLVCPADGRQWSVPLVAVNNDRLEELQSELKALLFTEE